MEQYDPNVIREFYRSGKLAYYVLNDIMYAGTFPEAWARDHAYDTGPGVCQACVQNGEWNGAFMMYCANCAIHVYEGTRGKGASGPGEEYDIPENRDYESAFDTYLYGVNLNDVGDPDIHDSNGHRIDAYFNKFIHCDPRTVLAGLKRMDDELCGNGEVRGHNGDRFGEREEYVEYFIDTNGTHEPMTDHNELPRQQYIPSKDECVRNPMSEYDRGEVEEPDTDTFTHYGTGKSWNESVKQEFDYGTDYTGYTGFSNGPMTDNNEHVAESGPSAFDWDESGNRRFYGMGYDEYRMGYDADAADGYDTDTVDGYDADIAHNTAAAAYDDADYADDDDEYGRRRHCCDSRTVSYDSDDELPRQQYIPSKGECVRNPMSEYDNEEVEVEERVFTHYGTGKPWNESLKHQFDSEPEPSSPPTSSGQNVRQDSVYQYNGPHTAMSEDDFDHCWNSGQSAEQYRRDQGIKYYGGYEETHSLNTQESVPEPDMPFEPEAETETESERELELDEAVHCMICENTKFTCACDEDLIHQSVFCYTCEKPRYICNCSEESRNQTHYCLHCTKVKYQCICVGENSVYLRVARKYCMQQCRVPDGEEEI